MTNPSFLPVLLGSDINAYGMARSFHEEYGVTSLALASFPLAPTRYSRIVNVHVHESLADPEAFLAIVLEQGKELSASYDKLVLVPCGDSYAELVSRFQKELSDYFIVATPAHDLLQKLVNKASFYELCATHGIAHPATRIITAADAHKIEELEIPFSFPIALKPSDSVSYLNVSFEGRKKAYILDSAEEVRHIVREIYAHGYTDTLVLQEYIPGDDSHMRVLNAYVDASSTVRMMCLGNPLLEDHAPDMVGNYTVIRSSSNQDVYHQIQKFLHSIGYVGFANFDMKFDARDGSYKLFELNPRQGRSSFFVTLAGYNLARYLIEDRVFGRKTEVVYADRESLWMQIPKRIFLKYVQSADEKKRAQALIRAGKWGTTLRYAQDMNLMRWLILLRMDMRYFQSYRRYFTARSDNTEGV
jgi:D-aspartate ligase